MVKTKEKRKKLLPFGHNQGLIVLDKQIHSLTDTQRWNRPRDDAVKTTKSI